MNINFRSCSMRRVAASFVLALGFAFPASSFAKSDQGAYTFKDSYCFDWNSITVCYANSAIIQHVDTPSGNSIFVVLGSSTYTETDSSGTLLYEDSLSYRNQGLTLDEALLELQQWYSEQITYVDGSSCTTAHNLHNVKGEIVVDRVTTCY